MENIGKYKILGSLAKGGMGEVFKAEHPTLNRTLVIKRLTLRGNKHIQERFLREAQIMMDFKSDYVVNVYDHFKEGSYYHMVQEYVDGLSLEALIERERYLPEFIALRIFLSACRALKYAHDRGVIHRDIKPANLLISKSGEVKLVDFGIAAIREEEEDASSGLTKEGMTLGTPSYMAPEQFQSTRSVDKRADIYSLGIMLYESVTGKKPYPGAYSLETVHLIHKGKYKNPRKINPRLSNFLIHIIKKTMNAKIRRRYQDLGPLIEKIETHLGIKPSPKNPHESAPLLSEFLGEKPIKVPSLPFGRKKILGFGLLFLVLLGSTLSLFYTGWPLWWAWGANHGSLQVEILIPEKLLSTSAPSPTLTLVSEKAPGWQMPLPLWEVEGQKGMRKWVELPRVFESGNYRLEARVDSTLVRRSFFLLPRPLEGAGNLQTLEFPIPPAHLVKYSWNLRDKITGRDLTRKAAAFISSPQEWLPLDNPREVEIPSGTPRILRFILEGYETLDLTVNPENRDSSVNLFLTLVPLTGALEISSDRNWVRIFINGQDQYLQGGQTSKFLDLPRLSDKESRVLRLPPGNYTLGVEGPGGERVEKTIKLKAATLQKLRVESPKGTPRILIQSTSPLTTPQGDQ